MSRLNNKGFAFSTILYGLMIMCMMVIFLIMSTMQTNRLTNKNFVQNIEEELNRYSLTSTSFTSGSASSTDGKEYIVPVGQAGWYKIELWGAQGQCSGSGGGGLGAYTSGMIWLDENTHLYFYIGKRGSSSGSKIFNGGGSSNDSNRGSGGGATDVRLVDGSWSDSNSLASRIMVAAGGGGYGGSSACTNGGTILGIKGAGSNGGNGGSQASTGANLSLFGNGANSSVSKAGSGGGGYFGGSSGSGANSSGGSGSSYISGYAGVVTYGTSNPTTADAVSFKSGTTTYNFINGLMIEGAREGDGAAKIEKVSSNDKNNPPSVLNNNIYGNNIQYIKDCISGSSTGSDNTPNYWREIQVIENGKNIAIGRTAKAVGASTYQPSILDGLVDGSITTGSSGTQCMLVDLGSAKSDISEIAVWHNFTDNNLSMKNHYVQVSSGDDNWVNITSPSNNDQLSFVETSNGNHYSSWQIDSTGVLPNGTYYIMSANSSNLALTKKDVNAILNPFSASDSQKWSVENIGGNFYKISTARDSLALQILNGTEYEDQPVGVGGYAGGYDWEKWQIIPVGNGSYKICSGFGNCLGPQSTTYNQANNLIKTQSYIEASSDRIKNRAQRFKFLIAMY